jgi:hypothetical protein
MSLRPMPQSMAHCRSRLVQSRYLGKWSSLQVHQQCRCSGKSVGVPRLSRPRSNVLGRVSSRPASRAERASITLPRASPAQLKCPSSDSRASSTFEDRRTEGPGGSLSRSQSYRVRVDLLIDASVAYHQQPSRADDVAAFERVGAVERAFGGGRAGVGLLGQRRKCRIA